MVATPTREDIEKSAERIARHVRRTPVLDVGHAISDDYEVVLKLEHTQVTGSFKPRGAFSLLTASEIPDAGVVAASGGNFGIAAAYAAHRLGHSATVFVPATSPPENTDRICTHGADVRVIDGYYDEALRASSEHAASTGAFVAHAYDQFEVMSGQGTLAREALEQTKADGFVVAVGGGGLIGGIASWSRDEYTVYSVEPMTCNSLHASLEAGRQVEVEVRGVASSSLGARSIGNYPWAARQWVDESVLVTDDDIVEAQKWLWSEYRLVVEPAAATTVAGLRSGALAPEPGARLIAVLSGGNVDPSTVV